MNWLYDAGVLIAADREDRATWAQHRLMLELGYRPITTAPVIAQASRSSRQARLHRLLRGCNVVPFSAEDAHEVGGLLAAAGTSDVVDGHAVLVASRSGAVVVTSDIGDIAHVASYADGDVQIRPV